MYILQFISKVNIKISKIIFIKIYDFDKKFLIWGLTKFSKGYIIYSEMSS